MGPERTPIPADIPGSHVRAKSVVGRLRGCLVGMAYGALTRGADVLNTSRRQSHCESPRAGPQYGKHTVRGFCAASNRHAKRYDAPILPTMECRGFGRLDIEEKRDTAT